MTIAQDTLLWKQQIHELLFKLGADCQELLVTGELENSHIANVRGALQKLDLCVFQGFNLLHKQHEAAYARPEPTKPRLSLDDLFADL